MSHLTFGILICTFVPHALLAAEPVIAGLTRTKQVIRGYSVSSDSEQKPNVILIGGLNGDPESSKLVRAEVDRADSVPILKRRFNLTAIPLANPDRSALAFPPTGIAYRDNPESHYLWRWIATQAPDLVIIAGDADFGLSDALSKVSLAGFGKVNVKRLAGRQRIAAIIGKGVSKSEVRIEAERRVARTPKQVAEELSTFYGHDFGTPVYIPAVAMIGRLRLGQGADLEQLVAPYRDGGKKSLAPATSSHLAGHLLFADLAERTGDAGYLKLALAAADLAAKNPMDDQMSDSVFMVCPILSAAGKLTGNTAYFDRAASHLQFMRRLCLREDGLYRHSPLNEAAWGRGNAFPALGLALTLSTFPKDHPSFSEMLLEFQNQMATLARFQGSDGMWREVIDHPGVYSEFSATAMIATAMIRGIRNGWLDAKAYDPHIQAAWRAVNLRIGRDGEIIDVCESTGKQKSADDYLYRAASLGRDARGGGMALLLATEICCLP